MEYMAWMRKGLLKAEIWMDLQHPFLLKDIKSAFDKVSKRERIKALVKLSIINFNGLYNEWRFFYEGCIGRKAWKSSSTRYPNP